MPTTREPNTEEEHDLCESCGSDEHVHDGLCIDCREDQAEWDSYQDWDY